MSAGLEALLRSIGGGKPMSPMDSMEWFQAVKCTFVGSLSGTPKLAVGADPQRVAIVFSSSTSTIVAPETAVLVAGGGIQISSSFGVISFTQDQYGPLVQSAWYALNSALGNVTVVEVLLRSWPGDGSRRQKGGSGDSQTAAG